MLSYEYWRTRFNANPAIIGSVIRVNNTPLTVIGVVRPGFEGMEPGIPTKLFVPLMMTPALRPGFDDMFNRRQRWVNVYGRLKTGFTIDRASKRAFSLSSISDSSTTFKSKCRLRLP